MTPAETVIDLFGGISATARVLGVDPSSVARWKHYQGNDGKVGRVPQRYFEPLLKAALAEGKHLTPDHLIFGFGVTRLVIRVTRADPFDAMAESLST